MPKVVAMTSSFELFFWLAFFTHFTYVIPKSNENPVSIFTRLVHRDSVKSPCYKTIDCSVLNYANHPWRSSIAQHFPGKSRSYNAERPHSTDIEANLRVGDRKLLFFVEFYIASQSTPQYGAMDTGSYLLWIHCAPCENCSVSRTPMYDPRMSTTYKHLSCNSIPCNLAHSICDTNNKCIYSIRYAGEQKSVGYLATETLRFGIDDGGFYRVPNVVFGCNKEPSNLTGVFGLGYHNLSLASRFGKFSYCVGSLWDPNYEYNRLVLGDGAVLEGNSTSLIVDGLVYYVTLEGISLGDYMLEIPSRAFRFRKGHPDALADGGVIIDSGASMTLLVKDAYNAIVEAVEDNLLLRSSLEGVRNRLCFYGEVKEGTRLFPGLTFHFSGGAKLTMGADSLFEQTRARRFCMTIEQSWLPFSIIGMDAQQHHNVGYDIIRKKIYFQRMKCEALEG